MACRRWQSRYSPTRCGALTAVCCTLLPVPCLRVRSLAKCSAASVWHLSNPSALHALQLNTPKPVLFHLTGPPSASAQAACTFGGKRLNVMLASRPLQSERLAQAPPFPGLCPHPVYCGMQLTREAQARYADAFRREIFILRSCHDRNIVQFLGACLQVGGELWLPANLPAKIVTIQQPGCSMPPQRLLHDCITMRAHPCIPNEL